MSLFMWLIPDNLAGHVVHLSCRLWEMWRLARCTADWSMEATLPTPEAEPFCSLTVVRMGTAWCILRTHLTPVSTWS